MAACVGAFAVREVVLYVRGGHIFSQTLYVLSIEFGKRAVEIGPATVERATRGRYDWQDGGLRKRRREDEREEGERRLRPRDPGKRGKHQ